MMELLLKGIVLGFILSAPVGPVNLLCMRRTLFFGKRAGLVSGLGAALADTAFAIVAAFGFRAIGHFLRHYGLHIHIFGGIILCVIAWKIYHSVPKEKHIADRPRDLWKYFATAFLLTMTNPATIFSFMALFSVIGREVPVVVGIFIGAMAWWTVLTLGISRLKISNEKFVLINKAAAILIAVLGVVSLLIK